MKFKMVNCTCSIFIGEKQVINTEKYLKTEVRVSIYYLDESKPCDLQQKKQLE